MTPDDSVAAGELALGLLDGDELAAATRRVLTDPVFAAEVDRWRGRFATMLVPIASQAPAARVGRRALAVDPVTRRWRALAVMSTAVAAALLVGLVTRPTRDHGIASPPAIVAAPATLVAAMAPTGTGTGTGTGTIKPFLAVYNPSTRTLVLTDSPAVPSRRNGEMWSIGGDGIPHALGLLTHSPKGAVIVVAPAAKLSENLTLAISIEPIGGAPGEAPSGPVIATGALRAI